MRAPRCAGATQPYSLPSGGTPYPQTMRTLRALRTLRNRFPCSEPVIAFTPSTAAALAAIPSAPTGPGNFGPTSFSTPCTNPATFPPGFPTRNPFESCLPGLFPVRKTWAGIAAVAGWGGRRAWGGSRRRGGELGDVDGAGSRFGRVVIWEESGVDVVDLVEDWLGLDARHLGCSRVDGEEVTIGQLGRCSACWLDLLRTGSDTWKLMFYRAGGGSLEQERARA